MSKRTLLAILVAGNALLASCRIPGDPWELVLRRQQDDSSTVAAPDVTVPKETTPRKSTTSTTTDSTWVLKEFPWVVGFSPVKQVFTCTGVLIQDRWVLTTVLCLQINPGRVVYGPEKKQVTAFVDQTVRHPYFRYETNKTHIITMYNDIGLVYLKAPINANMYKNKSTDEIPMSKEHLSFGAIDYSDQVVTVYGYGFNARYNRSLPKKSRLRLKICTPAKWAYAHCDCMVNQLVNVSYCAADSGAPVLVNDVLVGLATLAPHSCRRTHIMTFNSIYEQLPWIFWTLNTFTKIYKELAAANANNSEANCYFVVTVSFAVLFVVG